MLLQPPLASSSRTTSLTLSSPRATFDFAGAAASVSGSAIAQPHQQQQPPAWLGPRPPPSTNLSSLSASTAVHGRTPRQQQDQEAYMTRPRHYDFDDQHRAAATASDSRVPRQALVVPAPPQRRQLARPSPTAAGSAVSDSSNGQYSTTSAYYTTNAVQDASFASTSTSRSPTQDLVGFSTTPAQHHEWGPAAAVDVARGGPSQSSPRGQAGQANAVYADGINTFTTTTTTRTREPSIIAEQPVTTGGASLDRWNSTRRLMAQLEPDDAESLVGDRGTWATDPRESLVVPDRLSLEIDDPVERIGSDSFKSSRIARQSTMSTATVDGADPFHYSVYATMSSPNHAAVFEMVTPVPAVPSTTVAARSAHRPVPLTSLPPRKDSNAGQTPLLSASSTYSPAPFRIEAASPDTEAFLSDPRARLQVSTPSTAQIFGLEPDSASGYYPSPTSDDHSESPSSPSVEAVAMSSPTDGPPPTFARSSAHAGRVVSRTSLRNFSRPFVAAPPSGSNSNDLAVPPTPRPQHDSAVRSNSDDSIDQLARQSSLGHSSSMGHSTNGHESSMGHGGSSQGGHSMSSSWEERRLMGLRGLELTKRDMLIRSASGAMEELKEEERVDEACFDDHHEGREEEVVNGLGIRVAGSEGKNQLPTPRTSPSMSRRPSDTSSVMPWLPEGSPSGPASKSQSDLNRPFLRAPDDAFYPHSPSPNQSPSQRAGAACPPSDSSPRPPSPSEADSLANRVSHLQNPRPPPSVPDHQFLGPIEMSSHFSNYDETSPRNFEFKDVQTPSPSASPPRQRNVLRKARRPSDPAKSTFSKGLYPSPPEGSMPSPPSSTARALEVALREDPFASSSETPTGRWAKFRSRSRSRGSKSHPRPSFGSEFDGSERGGFETSASMPAITFEPPSRPIGDLRDLAQRAKELSEQRRAWDQLPLKPSVAKSVAAGIVQRGDGRDLAPGWVQQGVEDEMESLAAGPLRPPGTTVMQRSVSDQGPRRSDQSIDDKPTSGQQSQRPGTSTSLCSDYSFYSLPVTPLPGSKSTSPRLGSSGDAAAMFEATMPRAPSSMSIANSTMLKAKAGMRLEPKRTTDGKVVPRGEPVSCEDFLLLGIDYHENGELPRAAWCFEQSAKRDGGCAAGLLMYGLTLRHGWGCQVNTQLGFKYLQAAAESVVEDLDRVVAGNRDLDTKAAKNELVLALHEIGVSFRFGWGVPRDKKMAVAYFTLSADLGDVDAQTDLAFCYANGKGCKKDLKMAAHYYRLGVAQGAESFGLSWIYKSKYND